MFIWMHKVKFSGMRRRKKTNRYDCILGTVIHGKENYLGFVSDDVMRKRPINAPYTVVWCLITECTVYKSCIIEQAIFFILKKKKTTNPLATDIVCIPDLGHDISSF